MKLNSIDFCLCKVYGTYPKHGQEISIVILKTHFGMLTSQHLNIMAFILSEILKQRVGVFEILKTLKSNCKNYKKINEEKKNHPYMSGLFIKVAKLFPVSYAYKPVS